MYARRDPDALSGGPSRRTKFEAMQPSLLAYAAGISIVSPGLTAYQLTRVFGKPTPPLQLARMSVGIFPHQVALKWLQMNAATPVKENLNPFCAFFVVGVLQGGVYGQTNVHFSRVLKLSQNASYAGAFRGSLFAGLRDTVSQGLPFVCSAGVQRAVVDPLLASDEGSEAGHGVRRALAVFGTSIFATFLSQGAHNCQLRMQADQSLGYGRAVHELWTQHGVRMLYMGASARVALLLLVNSLNELLLKKAWATEAKSESRQARPPQASTLPSLPSLPFWPFGGKETVVFAKEEE